jgi:hypothetical protein
MNFLFSTASRLALGPTQPPSNGFLGTKRQEREADDSLPSSPEVKNGGTSMLQYIFVIWYLIN